MPRTVVYDLKGGFGSLKKLNALYDVADDTNNNGVQQNAAASSSSLWGGRTVVQKSAPIAPSEYQQSLDAGLEPPQLTTETVRYWSDFNRVFYHPRSIVQLNEYELNSSLVPFERWETGEELFASLDKEHDIVDRDLRPFVEEADQMQGVQIMATLDDAWGGFASRYAERLRDEYGKTMIWVWGLQEGFQGVNRVSGILVSLPYFVAVLTHFTRRNGCYASSTRPSLSQNSTNKHPLLSRWLSLSPLLRDFVPCFPWTLRLPGTPQLFFLWRSNPLHCRPASRTYRIGTPSGTLPIC